MGGPPEWSDEDRAKVTAYLLEKGQRCDRCGTAEWEWDPAQGGSLTAYVPMLEDCTGCGRKAGLQIDKDHDRPGRSVTLVPQARARQLELAAQDRQDKVRRRREAAANG